MREPVRVGVERGRVGTTLHMDAEQHRARFFEAYGRSFEEAQRQHGDRRLLVLGASGYVGGRLVPRLLDAGYPVRVFARSPEKLKALPWADDVEIAQGDLLDRESMAGAFRDVYGVYHLVHSMGHQKDFVEADRRIAEGVAEAAERNALQRIVYLGGLGEVGEDTSVHLRSRAEVGQILRGSSVPATVLRAAIVIGSGSASFEMLRHLVERLPVMITPRWVDTKVQPIAIRDVLRYLLAVMDDPDERDRTYDIGGPEVLTYLDMLTQYAQVAGLRRRLIIPVPVLTTTLSSYWVNLMTPVPFGIAKPLVEGLTSDVVVRDENDVTRDVPGDVMEYREAVDLALRRIHDNEVTTSWMDADLGGRSPADPYPGDPDWTGGTLLRDVREHTSSARPEYVFAAITRIGGRQGWPSFMWAWKIRGRLDRLVGGVGLRRGRRDPYSLRVGDALDLWRVEALESGDEGTADEWLLRLRAEMIMPGRAWLEFRVKPDGDGSRITQRALFAPKGVPGRLYWWMLLPIHPFIFRSMVATLGRDAEDLQQQGARIPEAITSTGGRTDELSVRAASDGQPPLSRQPARRAG